MAMQQRPGTADETTGFQLSEILGALSYALDLTEDAVPGHALRSCLLGMRLAAEIGMPADEQASLYYSLLLKDAGCSSNSSRMCQIIGGDDRSVKTAAKLEDWTRPHSIHLRTVGLLWKTVLPGHGAVQKAARLANMALTQHANNREMIALRCDRGATIASKLGLGEATAEAVRHLDEHWDGSGYPDGLRGEAIPMASRIMAVAQHLDVFSSERTPAMAMQVLRERAGRWFDPALVKAATALERAGHLWVDCTGPRSGLADDRQHAQTEQVRMLVLALDPLPGIRLEASEVDNICAAFADVVDAKSPFTFRHSLGVAEAAERIAHTMGLAEHKRRLVWRAALLHDIGKLRVPNTILDKRGPLTPVERGIVEEHPLLSRQILCRVAGFAELASVAGAHHERMDGSGYPDRLRADDLPAEARILAVADVFGALTEDRPYRKPLPVDEVLRMMGADVPRKLDAECFQALRHSLTEPATEVPHAAVKVDLPAFPTGAFPRLAGAGPALATL